MGKGEIARYEQFLLFPLCFQKTFTADTYKSGLVWERVKKFDNIDDTNTWIENATNIPVLKVFFFFFEKGGSGGGGGGVEENRGLRLSSCWTVDSRSDRAFC